MINVIEIFLFSFVSAILVQKIIGKHNLEFIAVNAVIFGAIIVIFRTLISSVREGIDNLPIAKEERVKQEMEDTVKKEVKKEIAKEEIKKEVKKEMKKAKKAKKAEKVEQVTEPVKAKKAKKAEPVKKIKEDIPIVPEISEIVVKMVNGDTTVSRPVSVDIVKETGKKQVSKLSKGKVSDFVLMDPKFWLDDTPLRGVCQTGTCETQPVEIGSITKYLRVD